MNRTSTNQPQTSYIAGLVMMVTGIVLVASIFVSVYIYWGSERGFERNVETYFVRFLMGVSLIIFGNITRDIATRRPQQEEKGPDSDADVLETFENEPPNLVQLNRELPKR
ncbi:hypothetical protein SH449x_005262 [Pirellulaceae bacterium SH449]